MPNTDTPTEPKNKPPTGSSKRKRKQSIKRNIVSEDNSDAEVKTSKIEKTYGKKAKGDKGKAEKESSDIILVKADHLEESSNYKEKERNDEEEVKSEKFECTDLAQCNSSKQQCQNCKFCSEHSTKDNKDSLKEKQCRTKKKFPCDICADMGLPRVYNSTEKHKHHLAAVHGIYSDEVKRFECTECPETIWFPTKSKFVYHLGTRHPGIIKFVCDVCTETFKLKANYKNHMKTHQIVVQKKFSCDVCNGTFVNKAGYEAHKKRFPGPHIKQSCSHCGFSFSKEKHMKNHRCKTLLLQEAEARANKAQQPECENGEPVESIKQSNEQNVVETNQNLYDKKIMTDNSSDVDLNQKKGGSEGDSQGNKRVVLHRIIPRRNQEQAVYRPVQMQTQNMSDSVIQVQELREIDFEGGTLIAASEPEQYIVRDINRHLVPGNQILQLDINDVQPGEESQVYLADWNIVTPYVIREMSP